MTLGTSLSSFGGFKVALSIGVGCGLGRSGGGAVIGAWVVVGRIAWGSQSMHTSWTDMLDVLNDGGKIVSPTERTEFKLEASSRRGLTRPKWVPEMR